MRAWAIGLVVVMMVFGDSLNAYALDGHRRITQYAHAHFAARDGLPQSYVVAIAQTSDGYLWSSSQEGLSRFDGVGFKTFAHRTNKGIPSKAFTALAVDAAGSLWAGTRDRGVLHLVGGEFRPVAWQPGAREDWIRALAFDADGDLWIGTRGHGVVRLHDGVLTISLTTHDGLPSDDVRSFLVARDGTLWIGTFKGLVQWKAGRIARGPEELDGVTVHSIAQDAGGALWCATDKGLVRLRDDSIEPIDTDRLTPSQVRKLLFDRNGNLWIGTRTGVVRITFDGQAGRQIRGQIGGQIERLPEPATLINALFEDADGNVWIASDQGLDRLSDGDVLPMGASEGLIDESIGGVREDATGAMWITTIGGLYRIAPGQTAATRISADRGLYAIYPDSHGDVWFGGRDGNVGRWQDGRLVLLGNQDWERVRSLAETADGLWLGTEQGLFRMRGNRLADAVAVMPGVAVRAIVVDQDGSLWIATESKGLLRWRAGAVTAIAPGGPPHNTPVTTITLDADGAMWVGTEGAGLWWRRDGAWFVFTTREGMFDDLIWRILDDGLGNLWMSSNRGIWRVSRQQLAAVAAGKLAAVDSTVYGEADGMRDRECNGVADPAGWRTRDGRLWFPTGRGLVMIDPAHLHERRPPHARIESVQVNEQPQPTAGLQVLPARSARLEFGYTALALRSPAQLRFRYRLDGFEPDWNDAGTQRVARYTNLPPGEYQFIVQAGLDDKWGSADSVAVTLSPLFYQTGWFYALALLSITAATVAVPLMRMRRLRARARELDQRVQDAIGELKVLSGLLPICGWCKKIREDRGCWRKIEAYLSAHTDARFAHGICPECTDKMHIEESFSRITSQESCEPANPGIDIA